MADRVNIMFRALLAFALVMAGAISRADAEPRIALIVGNGAYGSVAPLDNPVNDARLMAQTLAAKGFAVTLLIDVDQVTMNRAIGQFGRDLRNAGADATGLFYYAGHGVQSFGNNYLLPVDAQLTDAADVGLVAVQAESVLRQMFSARNKTNIVILDACRNNPFEDIPDMDDNGLAEMKAPTGTFLAYSTAPGAVALDGADANSPFTKALVQQIEVPGQPIEQVFKATRVAVLEATGNAQTPWDTSSLTSAFYFVPPAPVSSDAAAAQSLWASVQATRDPLQVMLYLRAYPDSPFLDEARAFLNEVLAPELQPKRPPPPMVLAPVAPQGADPREVELISKAQATGSASDYQGYLEAFPQGTYSELARMELASLAEKPPAPAASPPAPTAAPPLIARLTYSTPLTTGDPETIGRSIEELAKGTPIYPPIEGIPDAMWKGQACSACHTWTRAALCDQSKTYLANGGTLAGQAAPLRPRLQAEPSGLGAGGLRIAVEASTSLQDTLRRDRPERLALPRPALRRTPAPAAPRLDVAGPSPGALRNAPMKNPSTPPLSAQWSGRMRKPPPRIPGTGPTGHRLVIARKVGMPFQRGGEVFLAFGRQQ